MSNNQILGAVAALSMLSPVGENVGKREDFRLHFSSLRTVILKTMKINIYGLNNRFLQNKSSDYFLAKLKRYKLFAIYMVRFKD